MYLVKTYFLSIEFCFQYKLKLLNRSLFNFNDRNYCSKQGTIQSDLKNLIDIVCSLLISRYYNKRALPL